jgi:hypothetical protein
VREIENVIAFSPIWLFRKNDDFNQPFSQEKNFVQGKLLGIDSS